MSSPTARSSRSHSTSMNQIQTNGHTNSRPPNYGSLETTNNGINGYSMGEPAKPKSHQLGSINCDADAGAASKQSLAELEACQRLEETKEERASLVLRLAKRIPCLGIMFALCASLFLGSAGMLVKMTRSVHGIQVAVLRATIQLLIYGFVISVRKLPLWPERSELKPVMGRAFLGAASITFSYYALRLIPLGDATTIRFSLPIWTLIISYLVLGEPCNILRVVAVIVSISGVVLIAKPEECVYLVHWLLHSLRLESDQSFGRQQDSFAAYTNISNSDPPPPHMGIQQPGSEYRQFEGSLLALGSSICLSMSLVAMRLCRKTPAELVILWLSIIGIVIGSATLLALNEWSMPDNWLDVLYILLNGLCGAIGQWFITNALKVEQSGIISLVRTFDIEVAFLYSAFLLHEHIRITSIVGSCLVTVGVLAVLVPKWLWPSQSSSESSSSAAAASSSSSSSSSSQRQQLALNHNTNNESYGTNNMVDQQQQGKQPKLAEFCQPPEAKQRL